MAAPTVLEVFITLARRPHHRCTHYLRSKPTQYIRFASSSPSSAASPSSKQPQQPPPPPSPASKIPLHVGLDRNPNQVSAISKIPIPQGRRGETFIPRVLSRPLGLPYPPQPGQNSPYDKRTWSERRDDFANRNKALERRRVYLRSYLRPYFQEWKRMDYNKGKSFQSNERMFKPEKALYFPNIVGDTLSRDISANAAGEADTVPVMKGKISVVAMMSGLWAQEQVESFISPEKNPELQEMYSWHDKGLLQRVDVNMQSDWMRMWLVRFFKGRLRKEVPENRWGRYFMVKLPRDIRLGLTEEIRDAMGLLNSQVGYVYLVDAQCKIRWAGSGYAWDGEVEGLNNAVKRLLREQLQLKGSSLVEANGKQIPALAQLKVDPVKPMVARSQNPKANQEPA